MSYEPASHPIQFQRSEAGELVGLSTRLLPTNIQRVRKLMSALIIASAVSACTGGAGLDIPIGPVDHNCHTFVMEPGGDGSGCS
jgi:hypothetical protein